MQKVEEFGSMMEGMLLILGYSTRVLMDSGATHSFVLESFTRVLSRVVEPKELGLEVATLSGEVLSSSQCFCGVEVEVADQSLPIDLRVL